MTTEFERNINDHETSVAIDISYQDRPLLIAFGGIAGAMGIPPFEFFNLTRDLDINKIYIRDLSQTWYHSGLPGISKNIDETASFLKRTINESSIEKVIVIGNSMGGYAAILFGMLIQADVIHAFAPHTNISDEKFIRYKKQIRNVHATFSNAYFDLNELLKFNNSQIDIHLYYDVNDPIDEMHIKNLKYLCNVTSHAFNGGGHDLIRVLRDAGILQKIIISSFNRVRLNADK